MPQTPLRFFRFSGVLNRPGFALHLGIWLAAMLTVALAATSLFDLTVSEAPSRFWDEPFPDALLQALVLWTLLALGAQRIRDMGFPVLPCLLVLAAIELLETWLLPQFTEARLPAPLEEFTPLGGLLSIVSLAWLLFWPGAEPRRPTAPIPSSGRPDPSRRSDASPPPPA